MGPGALPYPTGTCIGRLAQLVESACLTPLRGDVNPGKKSSKSNQDCTICRSCRETMTGPVVLE